MLETYVFLFLVIALIVLVVAVNRLEQDRKTAQAGGFDRKPTHPPGLRPARVHKIIDGDTVMAIVDRRKVTIRLDGIDCPENGQRWGNTAKAGLIKLIGGQRIRVEERCTDQYGRTVATIYVRQADQLEWTNVNTRMVALGHAWVSSLMCRDLPKEKGEELIRIQRWARKKRVGLWRDDDPVPPWKFRRSADQNYQCT